MAKSWCATGLEQYIVSSTRIEIEIRAGNRSHKSALRFAVFDKMLESYLKAEMEANSVTCTTVQQ